MTDRGIIMSAPMIKALLGGRKTQTRRLAWRLTTHQGRYCEAPTVWQKAQPGDRIWVKETFRLRADQDHKPPSEDFWKSGAWYYADDPTLEPSGCGGGAGKIRQSIFMPRWASRLTLVVTEVRRQRLQQISEEDCLAEGIQADRYQVRRSGDGKMLSRFFVEIENDCPLYAGATAKESYELLWTGIHGRAAWDDNPEVVALTFTVHQANIDRLEEAA